MSNNEEDIKELKTDIKEVLNCFNGFQVMQVLQSFCLSWVLMFIL